MDDQLKQLASEQITRYALGMLPPLEKESVEMSVAHSAEARAQLQQERCIGNAIRNTIQAVPPLSAERLQRRMPKIPTGNRPIRWHRTFALVTVLLFFMLTGFGLQKISYSVVEASPAPSFTTTHIFNATATPSKTPTTVAYFKNQATPTPLLLRRSNY